MFVLTFLRSVLNVGSEMLVNPHDNDEFAIPFRFGSSTSPNSLTIEVVSHGDSGWEDDVCCGLFAAKLFWKTLQTTHSSYKSKTLITKS